MKRAVVLVLVAESCLVTLWTVACQAPSVLGILQARILEWVAISFFRGDCPHPLCFSGTVLAVCGHLPDPRIEPVSPALAGGFFTTEPPGKLQEKRANLFCFHGVFSYFGYFI